MNCQTLQNRMLALPDPRQLPEPLRVHVAGCVACRDWWKRAVRLERMLGQLPAPPAPGEKKAALLAELTATDPPILSVPAIERPGRPFVSRLRSLPGAKTIAGIAAALLIAFAGWSMTRPGRNPAISRPTAQLDPFLEKIVQRDLALAQARAPEQRLEVLGGLAGDLSTEAKSLSKIAKPEELRDLSGMFQKVVNEGIVKQAGQMNEHALTLTQKQELLGKLTAKLSAAARQADEAALESPPHAQPALKTIAEAARDGQVKLKAILGASS